MPLLPPTNLLLRQETVEPLEQKRRAVRRGPRGSAGSSGRVQRRSSRYVGRGRPSVVHPNVTRGAGAAVAVASESRHGAKRVDCVSRSLGSKRGVERGRRERARTREGGWILFPFETLAADSKHPIRLSLSLAVLSSTPARIRSPDPRASLSHSRCGARAERKGGTRSPESGKKKKKQFLRRSETRKSGSFFFGRAPLFFPLSTFFDLLTTLCDCLRNLSTSLSPSLSLSLSLPLTSPFPTAAKNERKREKNSNTKNPREQKNNKGAKRKRKKTF